MPDFAETSPFEAPELGFELDEHAMVENAAEKIDRRTTDEIVLALVIVRDSASMLAERLRAARATAGLY